jgi:hypothetical protein
MEAGSTAVTKNDGVGAACVGWPGIILLGLYLVVAACFSAYSVVTLWPPEPDRTSPAGAAIATPSPGSPGPSAAAAPAVSPAGAVTHTRYLGMQLDHTLQQRMLLVVLFAGALGGVVHALRSFFWYVGNRDLRLSWVPLYLLLPLTGSLLGLVFYIVLVAGLFAGAPGQDAKPAGFAAIAALVGMFSTPAAEKLQEIFETIFTKRPQGKDTVKPADVAASEPVVQGVTVTATAKGTRAIAVKGTDFRPPLTVKLTDAVGGTVRPSAANATASGFDAETSLAAGNWMITVVNADGNTSAAFGFAVD